MPLIGLAQLDQDMDGVQNGDETGIDCGGTTGRPCVNGAALVAFPGAVGYGKYASGGRYGSVYVVTNLNDSGAGSFRDAISQPNRTILFTVAGNIILSTTLFATQDNQTWAFNTAPGQGITFGMSGLQDIPLIDLDANNIIVLHPRIEHSTAYVGSSSGADGIALFGGEDIYIDHATITWTSDEALAITHYPEESTNSRVYNVTIANSIIGGGFTGSSKGSLITGDVGNVTYYRNYFPNNNIRSVQFATDYNYYTGDRFFEQINSVVYDYKTAISVYNIQNTGGRYRINILENLFEWSPGNVGYRPVALYESDALPISPQQDKEVYVFNNISPRRPNNTFAQNESTQGADGIGNVDVLGDPQFISSTIYNTQTVADGVTLTAATAVWDSISPNVGASLPYRNNFSQELVDNYTNQIEADYAFVTHTRETLASGTPWVDTDGDGIPDTFDSTPSVADANLEQPNGYTKIENEYIYKDYGTAPPPVVRPVITLDKTSESILTTDPLVDPIYTATDATDGDITGSVVIGGDSLSDNTVGTKVVTYNVTNSGAVAAFERTFTRTISAGTIPLQNVVFEFSEGGTSVGKQNNFTLINTPSNSTDITGSVLSSNDLVATATVSGTVVSVTGVSVGEATITYTPNDQTNGPLSDAITIQVIEQELGGKKILRTRAITIMD